MTYSYTVTFPQNYEKPTLPWKNKWVAALKSGKYKQGAGFLCEGGKYCCLGVLLRIQNLLKDNFEKDDAILQVGPSFSILKETGQFPEGVVVKIASPLQSPRWNSTYSNLTGLNDSKISFSDIGDIIDQIWEDGKSE